MFKKALLFLIILALNLTFTSCKTDVVTSLDDGYLKNIESKYQEACSRRYVFDEDADNIFKEEYKIVNLISHKVFIEDDSVNMDVYFNEKVEKNEIQNIKNFVMRNFVLKRAFPYGKSPYIEISTSKTNFQKVILKIFIKETKIIEEEYKLTDKNNLLENYYENTDKEFTSRLVENKAMKTFERKIRFKYWGIKDITFEKLYKGNVLLIKFKGNKVYKEKDVNEIKNLIETYLCNELEKEDKDKYGMNINYLGILIKMYDNGEKYHEETYHNGQDEKYWFSEYWGNHKFFSINN